MESGSLILPTRLLGDFSSRGKFTFLSFFSQIMKKRNNIELMINSLLFEIMETENVNNVGTESVGWCGTWCNWTDANLNQIRAEKHDYLIIGQEICPTTGTPHLQIYLYRKGKIGFNGLQKRTRGCRWVKQSKHSTAKQNQTYCSKEGIFEESGTLPEQGKRNDIEEVRVILRETGSVKAVMDAATNWQQINSVWKMVDLYEPEREWKPEVVWHYGDEGCGKTFSARKALGPKHYIFGFGNGRWWNGYDGHSAVLIDDVKVDSSDALKMYRFLLQVLDEYPMRVEVKGGMRQLLAKTIYVTSRYHPKDIFAFFDGGVELLRRINKIVYFSKDIKTF